MSQGKNSIFGIATGVALSQGFPPIVRKVRKMAFRFRRVLNPVWTAILVWLVAVVWRWQAPSWWPLALALPVLGALGAWLGPKLSERWARVVMTLVPDGLDKGQGGALDRPLERIWFVSLTTVIGSYLAVRVGWGPSSASGWLWQISLLLFGGTYWYHRRVRVLGRAHRYVKIWQNKITDVDKCPPRLRQLGGSKVTKAEASPSGAVVSLTIKLPEAYTADAATMFAEALDSLFKLRKGAVTVVECPESSHKAVVKIVPKDPWGDGMIDHPLPRFGEVSLAGMGKRFPLGIHADGSEDVYELQHSLIVGKTGAGKSGLLHSLMSWLVPCRDVLLLGVDMAGGATLGVWRRAFALPVATDAASAIAILQKVLAIIKIREEKLAERGETMDEGADEFQPTEEEPWVVLTIDEFPDLLAEAEGVEKLNSEGKVEGNMRRAAILLLGRIAKKARKCGIRLIFATQNGTKEDVGSKEMQAQLKAIFGMGLDSQQNRNLWQSMARVWDCTRLKKGEFLLNDEHHTEPDATKGYWVPAPQRRSCVEQSLDETGVRQVRLEPDCQAVLESRVALPIADAAGDEDPDEDREAETGTGEDRDRETRILEYLAEHWDRHGNGVEARTVAADLDIPPSTVHRYLDRLKTQGRARSLKRGKKGWWYLAEHFPTETDGPVTVSSIQGEQTGR